MLSLTVPNVLPVLSVVLFISLLNDGMLAFATALTSTASELFFHLLDVRGVSESLRFLGFLECPAELLLFCLAFSALSSFRFCSLSSSCHFFLSSFSCNIFKHSSLVSNLALGLDRLTGVTCGV